MKKISKNNPILLFDGVCNLCNHTVQFCIERDKNAQIKYASLQSDIGQNLLKKYHLDTTSLSTVVLIENNKAYVQSDVPLRLSRIFGGFWRVLYSFVIIPKFIRDGIYDFISKNRYKWFGKQDSCWMPTPELKNRFL